MKKNDEVLKTNATNVNTAKAKKNYISTFRKQQIDFSALFLKDLKLKFSSIKSYFSFKIYFMLAIVFFSLFSNCFKHSMFIFVQSLVSCSVEQCIFHEIWFLLLTK